MPNSVQLFFASRLSKAIAKIEMHRAISEYLGHGVKVVGFIVKRIKYYFILSQAGGKASH